MSHEEIISKAFGDTENALRDFISYLLQNKFGPEWIKNSGLTEERLLKLQERKETDSRRQDAGVVDDRLIYYSDFFDLKNIITKRWNIFSPAFNEKETIEVWLNQLEKLRNSDAHRRSLLAHQKELILGLSGEIRTKIARYRSSQETSDANFPRIEYVADNFGNDWKPGKSDLVRTGQKLRPGDLLEIIATATDPLGEDLEYQSTVSSGSPAQSKEWHTSNSFKHTIKESHVGRLVFVTATVRSKRKFHAYVHYDESIMFIYEVLPPH